jgi:hypothetical protein
MQRALFGPIPGSRRKNTSASSSLISRRKSRFKSPGGFGERADSAFAVRLSDRVKQSPELIGALLVKPSRPQQVPELVTRCNPGILPARPAAPKRCVDLAVDPLSSLPRDHDEDGLLERILEVA